uniref:Uncharacterized protein LOC110220134 isoform X1 n=1 Tax=Phascolarctos cinereus TaxID=38626 RepID=A0A6P5LUD2_PHACI|nr:uncharacterized protein LOC110220134 isoform X1 [Phascolarctos cinereus]
MGISLFFLLCHGFSLTELCQVWEGILGLQALPPPRIFLEPTFPVKLGDLVKYECVGAYGSLQCLLLRVDRPGMSPRVVFREDAIWEGRVGWFFMDNVAAQHTGIYTCVYYFNGFYSKNSNELPLIIREKCSIQNEKTPALCPGQGPSRSAERPEDSGVLEAGWKDPQVPSLHWKRRRWGDGSCLPPRGWLPLPGRSSGRNGALPSAATPHQPRKGRAGPRAIDLGWASWKEEPLKSQSQGSCTSHGVLPPRLADPVLPTHPFPLSVPQFPSL